MGEKKWTDEQLLAINTTGKTLLISAAAGSGKTATLTERIIRSILDRASPMDIRRMLIVTFTNAAVEELRQRIYEAIKNQLEKDPGNRMLEEQLLSVKGARIMTIDAFCNSIVKATAEEVGLQPNYRIADGAEEELLLSGIMDDLICSAYDGGLPEVADGETFATVAECLTSARGEKELAQVLKAIYEKTETIPEGINALLRFTDEFDPDRFSSVEDTRYGRYIIDKTKEALSAYKEAYEGWRELEHGSSTEAKGYLIFKADMELADACLCANDYEEIREKLNSYEFSRLPGGAGERGELYKHISKLHSKMRDDVYDIRTNYYSYSQKMWQRLYSEQYAALSVIFRFLKKFEAVFSEEKKRRGIAGYADIERYAYRALYNPDGTLSDTAKELALENDAVYIDEYQDVNSLQSKIFDAVSKPRNRFMVGDIKQSIYGFRSARPDIFKDMKNAFPNIRNSAGSDRATLFMSSNFRCDESIIRFTNGIFDTAFSLFGDSIGYTEEDRLKFAKIYDNGCEPNGLTPQIHVTPGPKLGARVGGLVENSTDEEESDLSYDAVAEKIKELLDTASLNSGKPVSPSDIAIILRSDKGRAERFRKALQKIGIKASVPSTADFFLNEEILLAMALLGSIDNPRKDIYLAALMMSPLYGFTADELVLARKATRKETLYEALKEYASIANDGGKTRRFLEGLEEYRTLSEGITVDELLSVLFRETGLLSLASKHGGKNNLILLHDMAKRHEAGSFKGLYSFISYVNEIISENKKVEFAQSATPDADAVKIITAHKSKGLEFPIAIYAGAGTKRSISQRDRIIFEEDFGFSMLLKDPSGLALVNNPIFTAVCQYRQEKDFEEELRVLYVILTRAREQLYIYGDATSSNCDSYIEGIELQKSIMSRYFLGKCTSPLSVILACNKTGEVIVHPGDDERGDAAGTEAGTDEPMIKAENSEGESKQCADTVCKLLIDRFSYKYPYPHHTRLPEKLSVSRLYPSLLDGKDDEASEINLSDREDGSPDRRPLVPEFISGKPADESAKRGIATHTYLQFCDLELLRSKGSAAELDRLIGLRYLSKKDGERVRLNEISLFERSELFEKMRSCSDLKRELRFNVKLPAGLFAEDDSIRKALENDEVLVQGVIDCLYEDKNGELHLVDYKTDRLTKEELDNPELGRQRLRDTHKLQLSYYREAVLRIYGKYPTTTAVYSLQLGEEIFI